MQSIHQNATELRHNLPAFPTTFIGHESAIATVMALLQQSRLLTLTGSGGSGKTRLALSVAEASIAEYANGVAWVDLAAMTDPALVPQSVAVALGLHEQPRTTFTELLVDYLCDRRLLIVLDNCEHVRTACAELLTAIFQGGSLTHILTTSREALGVVGEQVWLVPMLSVPPANGSHAASATRITELMQSDAVRLFTERAYTVSPLFKLNPQNAEAVAQICRLLDGMPLAIELAAARVNVLVPQQIVERLDNSVHLLTRSPHSSQSRHKTLRAALDWSFDLLSPQEQALFARLSIFPGSFGVNAVEGICAGQDQNNVSLVITELLDLLTNLVEKSLVVAVESSTTQYQEMRYRLLVPVRHYAAEHLRATDDVDLWRANHAAWHLALAQRAEPELRGAEQGHWFERLAAEHDNLRAALAWFAESPERHESGLLLSCAIALFWITRNHLSEGQHWLEFFLHHLAPQSELALQTSAMNFLGRIAIMQSNFQLAHSWHERALALGRMCEDDEGVESALTGLGSALWNLGEFVPARKVLEEAVAYARQAQHWGPLARALNNLSLVCMHQGDHAAARTHLDEGLRINQTLGNKTGIATLLFNLAMLAGHENDFERSQLLYGQALAMVRELGNLTTIADVLNNMGGVALAQEKVALATTYFEEAAQIYREIGSVGDTAYTRAGLGDVAFFAQDYAKARTYYTESLALFREAGNQRLIGRVLGQLGRISCREGNLVATATLCGEALSIRRTIGHKPGMIFILDQGFLELAVATHQPRIAARILGAIDRARRETDRQRSPMDAHELEPFVARIYEQLDEAQFAQAWAEGAAMTLDEIAAYALDTLSATATATFPPAIPSIISSIAPSARIAMADGRVNPAANSGNDTNAGVPAAPELRAFALGPARIYRGEQMLTSAEWIYAKARDLVFYLLCRPNSTREQIGLDFWPDASTEQVRKRFSAALAHARNALGREYEWIILREGRYTINPARACWFDVDIFVMRVDAANQLLQQGGASEQVAVLFEEAIRLYQGDFIEEFDEGEWFLGKREALLRAYLDALMTLGQLHVDAEHFVQAIAIYQQVLAKDPYLEEAHHALMRCYARINKRSQALRQYESLTTALTELGVTPSPEIQALVERLRRGEQL